MDFFKRSLASFSRPSATDEDLENLLKTEDEETSFSTKYGLPTTASRIIKKVALVILPNPMQRRLAPHLNKPPRIHQTSYLDGLRGMYKSQFIFSSLWYNPICNPQLVVK